MKTRRKSKAAVAAAEDETSTISGALSVIVPEDVDADILVEMGFSEPTNVDADAVARLYKLVVEQTQMLEDHKQQLEEAQANSERKEVELEQAVQDKEGRASELETRLDKAQNELKALRQGKDQLDKANDDLKKQVEQLATKSGADLEIKAAFENGEREKRELVMVVGRLKEDNSQRDEELKALRINLKEARQEHQELEHQLRQLKANETSSTFKIDSLTQQLDLSHAELERTTNELTTKSSEFSIHRRSAHQEHVTLQTNYDTLTQSHSSLQSSYKNLQATHTTLQRQLEDALAHKQDLSVQLAEKDSAFTSEVAMLKRLVTMLEEREAQHRDLVENIEKEWVGVGEKAEQREARLMEDTAREKAGREAAERRSEQLEIVLEKMNKGELPRTSISTPIRNGSSPGGDLTMDGMMSLSPTVAIASKAQKAGKTFTQVYADYVQLQQDYASKSEEYENMERTLNSVLHQIEERAPILSQQRHEYERLQAESVEMSNQLSKVIDERDKTGTELRVVKNQLTGAKKELQLNSVQLDDLGRQLQIVVTELERHNDPSLPSDAELVDLRSNPQNVMDPSSVDSLITSSLVLFTSVPELQSQNQKLLRVTRDLSRKLEDEEKTWKDELEKEAMSAVQEAHDAMLEMQTRVDREKKHWEKIVQGYVKEREMLRVMLDKLKKAAGVEVQEASGEMEDLLKKELDETKMQFDTYRKELGVDSDKLREQASEASRESASLSVSLAKANAKIEYLTERQRSATEQYNLQVSELKSLTSRHQTLTEQYARLDISYQSVSTSFTQANSDLSLVRTELANVKAEKALFHSVQSRLEDENKRLGVERGHLSDLLGNVQRMHGEIERGGENDRRRLEGMVSMLEGQIEESKTMLEKERDQGRRDRLEKEIEGRKLVGKVEKVNADLARTRECLIIAETSKKHLDEKVEDLAKHLRGVEEKLSVYERRPGAPSLSVTNPEGESDAMSLEAEVAELRSKLKVMELDLINARANSEQFKEISQASEDALASLNSTHDEYKSSTDSQIARYESEISALRDRITGLQNEVGSFQTRYEEFQKKYDEEKTAWLNDKRMLEDSIADLGSADKVYESDRTSREHEIRNQEGRAKMAEERYQQEVLLHAEDIKTVDSLKKQLSEAQTSSRENQKKAETAAGNLANSENSWSQQRRALDKDVEELNQRCKDLSEQNATLLQHLENVSSQASHIKDVASAPAAEGSSTEVEDNSGDDKLADLRSVLAYLRKQKEISDLQLELNKQENVRLRSQVDHLMQSLEETRKTLSEERDRIVENAASGQQHEELMERVNQLNILRESNATLRADSENYAKKATMLEAKLQDLSVQLEPAKEESRVAKAELKAMERQVKDLEEKSQSWQERNVQLLTKYDRIDPADVQALKDEVAQLKQSNTSIEALVEQQKVALAEKDQKASEEVSKMREVGKKNNSIFRTRMETASAEKEAISQARDALQKKIDELEAENTTLKASAVNTAVETSTQKSSDGELAALKVERDALVAERDRLLQERATLAEAAATSTASNGTGEPLSDAEKAQFVTSRDEALGKLQSETARANTLGSELQRWKASTTQLVEKLNAKNIELSTAKADLAAVIKGEPTSDSELVKKHAEELQRQAIDLTKKHQAQMKVTLEAAKLEATKASSPNQAAAIHAAETKVKELQARHASELDQAVERGRLEAAAKMKIKDGQLVKAKGRTDALEKYVTDLKAHVPANVLSTIPPLVIGIPAKPTGPISAGTPSTSASAGTPPARKQSISAQAGAPSSVTAPNRGAGRGTRAVRGAAPRGQGTRGGGAGRGTAGSALASLRGGPTRGGAPAAAVAGRATSGNVPMSIMGAAAGGKRPRELEEDGQINEESLAKRIKPSDAQPVSTAAPKGPVAIKRPPAQTQPAQGS